MPTRPSGKEKKNESWYWILMPSQTDKPLSSTGPHTMRIPLKWTYYIQLMFLCNRSQLNFMSSMKGNFVNTELGSNAYTRWPRPNSAGKRKQRRCDDLKPGLPPNACGLLAETIPSLLLLAWLSLKLALAKCPECLGFCVSGDGQETTCSRACAYCLAIAYWAQSVLKAVPVTSWLKTTMVGMFTL